MLLIVVVSVGCVVVCDKLSDASGRVVLPSANTRHLSSRVSYPGAHEAGLPVGRSVYPGDDSGAGHARLEHDARHPARAVLHGPRLEREVSLRLNAYTVPNARLTHTPARVGRIFKSQLSPMPGWRTSRKNGGGGGFRMKASRTFLETRRLFSPSPRVREHRL